LGIIASFPLPPLPKVFLGKNKTEKSKKGINRASSPENQIKYAGHYSIA